MDAIDRRIVELLTANGRLSYAELARQIGLSGPAVHERVGKLESTGVIRAYRAHVDRGGGRARRHRVHRHRAGASTARSTTSWRPCRSFTEIESCYFLAGAESFLILVRVPTIAELEQLIVRLNRIPGVASTRTTIALSTKWEGRPLPLPPHVR